MKLLANLLILPILFMSATALAQSKSVKEQNDYAKKQQTQAYEKKQQDNKMVDRNLAQQRYNAQRGSTPVKSYSAPPVKSYSPPPKPYTPPASSSYKRK